MKKIEFIMVRVSPEEKQKIKENAEKVGISMSEYVRYKALKKNHK